jgi:hypothetical protein
MAMSELEQILAEIKELKELFMTPRERPDDFVDASYIAARTKLSVRTVQEGKAGTNAIPRIRLKSEKGKRPLIRYQRSIVDQWIRDLCRTAFENHPQHRAQRFLERLEEKKRRRA